MVDDELDESRKRSSHRYLVRGDVCLKNRFETLQEVKPMWYWLGKLIGIYK